MKALQFINSFYKKSKFFYCLSIACILGSCGNENSFKNIDNEITPIKIKRFEQDLILKDTNQVNQNHFDSLAAKYKEFYWGFCQNTLNILPQANDKNFAAVLSGFVKYPGIIAIKNDVDSVFPDLTEIENGLSLAMDRFGKEFPKSKIPSFVSFISEYTEAHCVYDSVIGIGLDMYLGNQYKFYPIDFPEFMVKKMQKEYILPNTLKAIAISNFDSQLKDKRFLAFMLFEGKVRYFIKQLLPELNDTLVFGYSKKQMDWCTESEKQIWSYFIDKNLLFNKNPSDYMRFITDGPFTTADGIPQESAPNIGAYCGYKIIENYVENSGSSLSELMNNTNWDEILKQSKYRPN